MNTEELWTRAAQTDKDIWLYGMGDGADKILRVLHTVGVSPKGIFASDGFVRGQRFHDYTVTSYDNAVAQSGDMMVLICFGSARPEVIANVKRIMAQQETYAPDVPVYGEGVFRLDYVKQHRSELEQVYDMLADQQSKLVFYNTIQYKLTGNLQVLFDCESSKRGNDALLLLGSQERYLDLGAYRGDTIAEFLEQVNHHYESIDAVEPDRKSFAKLKAFAGDMDGTRLFCCCISDRPGTTLFSTKAGRNSSCGNGQPTPAESVDHLLDGRPVSYIKMDVEGQEAAALRGARYTVETFRPKLSVAAYHRNEDLFSLPLQVVRMRSDYRIFLRKAPGFPAWDLQYYFV